MKGVLTITATRFSSIFPLGRNREFPFFLTRCLVKIQKGFADLKICVRQIGLKTLRNLFLVSYLVFLVAKSSPHKADISPHRRNWLLEGWKNKSNLLNFIHEDS